VKHLCHCLAATKDKGLILRADASKAFEAHVDCNFAGNWDKEDAMNDPSTGKSRTGCIISYGDCPVLWASQSSKPRWFYQVLSQNMLGYRSLFVLPLS
jgi:hypothetical protein